MPAWSNGIITTAADVQAAVQRANQTAIRRGNLALLPQPVTTGSDAVPDTTGLLPCDPQLAPLLPWRGLKRGATITATGSTSLLLMLLAGAMRGTGAWAAPHKYERFDNVTDAHDPLIRMHWRLRIHREFPPEWSVLIGDILTNLRAALDHIFWAVVVQHSGTPSKPHLIQFPIFTKSSGPRGFHTKTRDLRPLVAASVWEVIEALQPFHGDDRAYTSPLEILRWLSNADKHRALHVVGRTAIDLGPTGVESSTQLQVVEDWRYEGPLKDGAVVARLKLKRPPMSAPLNLRPTPAFVLSLPICDDPVEYRSLNSLMPIMTRKVFEVLVHVSDRAGLEPPRLDDLNLGDEHAAVAAELGHGVVYLSGDDDQVRAVPLPKPVDR